MNKWFSNILILLPLLVLFLEQELFLPFSVYGAPNSSYEQLIGLIMKLVPFASFFFVLFNFFKIKGFLRICVIFIFAYFIYLIFESLFYYKSFIEFPHVFLKVLNLFVVFAFYILYKNKKDLDLRPLMDLILLALIIKIAVNPSAVSLGAFVSHTRLIPSGSTLLLLLPCLYFLNSYLSDFNKISLVKFFASLFFIIYFQHRSVWMAASVALLFNFTVLAVQRKIPLKRFFPYLIPVFFFGIMGFSLVTAKSPVILDKIDQEVNNILNPEQDKTGSWRMEQMESYWPFVKSHLLEGMRLKGFELPVQFFSQTANQQVFKEDTGHHFHSFYFDVLFYFGFLGLLMFSIISFYPIFMCIKYGLYKNFIYLILVLFISGSLIYGFAYNFHLYFWAIVGLSLAVLRNQLLVENGKTKALVK